MVSTRKQSTGIEILLQANRSATWQHSKLLLLFIAVIVGTIAIAWAWVGVWIILPFAGLELAALSYVCYRTALNSQRKQLITVESGQVVVSSGIYEPVQIRTFSRPAVHLLVAEPKRPLEPIGLKLADDDNSLVIGEFLNAEDRRKTRDELVNAGLVPCSDRWWSGSS